MISFDTQNKFMLERPLEWASWLEGVLVQEGYTLGELCYVFCSDEYLLDLNQKFLSHDTLTDIITFDYNVGKTINGEVYISTERVAENCAQYKVPMTHELARVAVHGVLHLCGYKDKSEEELALMRQREDFWISKFKIL